MPAWNNSPDHSAVVAELVAARKAAGLTQRQLAAMLELDFSIIAKIEIGQRNVSVAEFLGWCRAAQADAPSIVRRLCET